jgi:YjbE family integral membrane protein
MSLTSTDFWIALMQIIGVNIVLSGDNAVVIALAARSLPAHQQKKAVFWGSGAAVVMRIVLTIVAVELLRLPYLKLLGAGLLLWIAVQLLLPEDEGEGESETSSNLAAAIKTILIADLVMSLDNVIAVAAAAKGSLALLIIGLAISIPLVVFASTLLLTLMSRYPIIITIGAGLLGWVAGEMAVTDPIIKDWIDAQAAYLHYVAPALGAAGVIAVGTWLAKRAEAEHAVEIAGETTHPAPQQGVKRVLLAVDDSPGAARAVKRAISMRKELSEPSRMELHVVNVQPSLTGGASAFIGDKERETYHRELGEASVTPTRKTLDEAGVPYQAHMLVGDPGSSIAALADTLGADMIVMGTRGLSAPAGALLGSVAQHTLEHATMPVLFVKGQ